MATVILVRHGRSTANSSGILAGRLPDIQLDETGRDQVRRVGERLSVVPLVHAVSSPLERCRQTADAVTAAQTGLLPVTLEDGLNECGYGAWQGRSIADLSKDPLWQLVQSHPSHVTFPDGESLQAMATRAVRTIREIDARVEATHGSHAVWLAVSHGDVIKSILSEAYGSHLDHFQRVVVDPASVSVVRFTETRPLVLATNTHGGDLSWLAHTPGEDPTDQAVPGGGAGPSPAPPSA